MTMCNLDFDILTVGNPKIDRRTWWWLALRYFVENQYGQIMTCLHMLPNEFWQCRRFVKWSKFWLLDNMKARQFIVPTFYLSTLWSMHRGSKNLPLDCDADATGFTCFLAVRCLNTSVCFCRWLGHIVFLLRKCNKGCMYTRVFHFLLQHLCA
jgi:hypothetical protein